MNKMIRKLRSAATALATGVFVLCAALAVPPQVLADDTDVFFPEEDISSTGTVRPNILFVIDTSGSMSDLDTFTTSRLDRVKEAFTDVMNDLNPNVNVGLARYSNRQGGPIMFPVSPVDAIAETVEGADGKLFQEYRATGTGNEASQALSNAVTLSGSTLSIGDILTRTYSLSTTGDEDAEERSGRVDGGPNAGTGNNKRGRCSTDFELGADPATSSCNNVNFSAGAQTVAMRFTNIDLPKDAVISSARLVFTGQGSSNDTGTGNLTIRGEAADNSAAFVGSTENTPSPPSPPSGRNLTSANVTWTSVPTVAAEGTLTSPEVKTIVQEILNRSGWSSNNPMTFIIPGNSSLTRTVYSGQQGSSTQTPKLMVSFTSATASPPRHLGFRFTTVQIPQGVRVVSANLSLRADATQVNNPLRVSISVESNSNAAAYANTASNITSRTYSGTSVDWDIPSLTVTGDDVDSPDISDALNSLFSGASWCGGNALTIKLSYSSGTGLRSFIGSSQDASLAPILNLAYEAADPALATGCNRSTLTSQIGNTKSDDATEIISGASVNINCSSLSLGNTNSSPACGTASRATLTGLRFQSINIPRGATVISAFIDFTASAADSSASSLTIQGESAINGATFLANTGNLSTRRTAGVTAASASWTPTSWTTNTVYATSDMRTIVQELVNSTSWNSNNAMTFFITGSGVRRPFSSDGSTSKAPRLRIVIQGPTGKLTVRELLKQIVNGFQPVGFTPTLGALYEAGSYYRGANAFYGRTRGGGDTVETASDDIGSADKMRVNHRAVYDYSRGTPVHNFPPRCSAFNLSSTNCKTESWTGTTVYKTPLTDSCQVSNIVILSDGEPNNATTTSNGASNKTAKQLTESYIGTTCPAKRAANGSAQPEWICADELANKYFTSDLNSALPGTQNVKTFTIAFGADVANPSSLGGQFLRNIAVAGGGQFFTAESASDVTTAFRAIVSSILDQGTTFVSPAVTVNTFNRLTNRNELYFALFKPQNAIRWDGNLKRYQLFQRSTDPDVGIFDNDPAGIKPAVDENTGFFREDAYSFWSSRADGPEVAEGGAASKLTTNRNLYTNLGASDLTAAGNRVTESNASVTKALLGIPAATDAQRTSLIQWARGVDVLDEDGDGSITDARLRLYDPLHSEPALLSYGGTAGDPDIALFFGTNDGMLHAIDTRRTSGEEYWAFIPQELLPNLERYYTNNGTRFSRSYGFDGPLSFNTTDADNDGNVETGDRATLYAGLRRGGRSYYALDVTNRNSPQFKFKISNTSTGFGELGQSWSRAVSTSIKDTSGAARKVIIFSGGYDPVQDNKRLFSGAAPNPDSQGRAVYIADAETGALLWWAGATSNGTPNLAIPEMRWSVPATPALLDLDSNGFVDRIYLADAGGQVIRINIDEENFRKSSGDRTNYSVFAQLSEGGGTPLNERRFFSTPDVALNRNDNGVQYLSVSLGSGHRERPLNKETQDRFYILKDFEVSTTPPITPATTLRESDLTDITTSPSGAATARGIYLRLGSNTGEKALTQSTTFDGTILFATFQPGVRNSSQVCQATQGLSRFYLLSLSDGTAVRNFSDPANPDDTDNLTNADRSMELNQAGLPPDPVLVFPSISSSRASDGSQQICNGPECVSESPIIFIGAQQVDPGFVRRARKTYWEQVDTTD